MKKLLLTIGAVCAVMLTSRGSYRYTAYSATAVNVPTVIASESVADLNVGERVSLRYTTTKDDRTAGLANCKAAAIAALLKANGYADVIVAPEFIIDSDWNYVEVSGRPAKYTNFRSAN